MEDVGDASVVGSAGGIESLDECAKSELDEHTTCHETYRLYGLRGKTTHIR